MPYVYVPETPGQASTGYQPVPDRFSGNMRGNSVPQPGMSWGNPQTLQIPAVSQPAQPAPQNSGMIWVSSRQEADSYTILAGSAVALWDANNPIVYLRQADSTGKPSTKVYELVERPGDIPQQQPAPQPDMSRYITIEAAEEIIDRRVNDILAERLKRPQKANIKKEDTDNG